MTSARTLEASEPCQKGHGDPGCPEHCPRSYRKCGSKLDNGGLVMPCLCQVFCGNLFHEKVLPCFVVSVLRVLGFQNLKQPKKNNFALLHPWLGQQLHGKNGARSCKCGGHASLGWKLSWGWGWGQVFPLQNSLRHSPHRRPVYRHRFWHEKLFRYYSAGGDCTFVCSDDHLKPTKRRKFSWSNFLIRFLCEACCFFVSQWLAIA